MAKHRVRLLILAAASLAGLLPADATVRAECNDNIPVLDTPPIEGDRRPQYRGATGEDGTEPPPPPPEGEGGTPTPPGTGRPAPPPPPSAGPTPTPPGGGPGTPTRGGGKNASMSEGGLEHWEDWWHVHGDRYLDIRRNVRESERRAATAAGDATAVKAGSDDGDAPWDLRARALLLASFHDPKWTVRASAAVALGRSGTIAALPEFVRMGRTPVRDVRGSAAVGAGLLGDSLVVEDLGRIVFDPAEIEHLRGVVLVSLGLIGGPDATRVLLDFLDPAADGRRSGGIGRTQMLEETAVAALGMSGDPASLPFLRKTLGSGARSDRTRAFAATSLARLGDREAIPLLRQALRADDATLRQAGAIALGCYGPDAGADLDLVRAAREDRDASTRRFALLSLGRAGGPAGRAAPPPPRAAGRPPRPPARGRPRGGGGGRAGGPALGSLFRGTRDPEVRGALAVSLGLLRWTDSAPDLLETARSTAHHHLRGDCLVSLGLMGDRSALEPARASLADDHPDEGMVADASACLALLGERRALRRLPALLRGGLVNAHGGAAWRVLGLVGGPEVYAEIAAIAGDGSLAEASRAKAVEAVGALLDGHDLPVLSTVAMDTPFLLLQGPMRAVMGHR